MKHISKYKAPVVAENTTESNNALLRGFSAEKDLTTTDNGGLTYKKSGDVVLDFFAQAGAMRRTPDEAVNLFKKALAEDVVSAVVVLFYLRDVRGGQGERSLFRNCLESLSDENPDVFSKVVALVPEYGRWDDILFNDPSCLRTISEQLAKDKESPAPSLLAKWLPTINASSRTTRHKARVIAKALGMDDMTYRKTVRSLREKIRTVEEVISANKWNEVAYSGVPSQAMRKLSPSFQKHDGERFSAYLEDVASGKEKINASTLYPYEIYKMVMNGDTSTANTLWNNLPDYTRGGNALVMADVSGSMTGAPMSVAVSLALYFAEKNVGAFHGSFMTFSSEPDIVTLKGRTLESKMRNIEQTEWGLNTNLEKAYDKILQVAVDNDVPQDQMPSTLYIISDMEFDQCVKNRTSHNDMVSKYKKAGYEMPTVVFWNVNASGRNLPARSTTPNVSLVSGYSPTVFKLAVENKTPMDTMMDVVNSERYAPVVEAIKQ